MDGLVGSVKWFFGNLDLGWLRYAYFWGLGWNFVFGLSREHWHFVMDFCDIMGGSLVNSFESFTT